MAKATLIVAGLGALALGAAAGSAYAASAPIDPTKVQSLATALEAALSGQGCGATSAQDEATIEIDDRVVGRFAFGSRGGAGGGADLAGAVPSGGDRRGLGQQDHRTGPGQPGRRSGRRPWRRIADRRAPGLRQRRRIQLPGSVRPRAAARRQAAAPCPPAQRWPWGSSVCVGPGRVTASDIIDVEPARQSVGERRLWVGLKGISCGVAGI